MAGAAGHADGFAAGKGRARSFDCLLEYAIHHGGGASTKTLQLNTAAALRGDLGGHALQQTLQAVDDTWVIVANLKQHFCTSRDDARRTGIEADAAGGPYGARSTQRGEPIVDGHAKS